MSNYRDDTQETCSASDEVWARLGAVAGDSALTVSTILFALLVGHFDNAVAADDVFDSTASVVFEQATACDETNGILWSSDVVQESGRPTEILSHALLAVTEEAVQAGDYVQDKGSAVAVDIATASDTVIGQRFALTILTESAYGTDFTGQFSQVLVDEFVFATDIFSGINYTRELLLESALVGDEFGDSSHSSAIPLTEYAVASAAVLDVIQAIQRIEELAGADDSFPIESGNGQAWTSNVDTWAMSRYAPFSFNGLVVIDGILYGTRDDGVYRISGKGDEVINGKLTTGKLDLGNNGALVHPFSAYLEHELNSGGSATLDVTSTQSGIAETYSYMLTSKPADELTNGRFLFGRGLRGRHFSVSLNISAKHAYINDLRIESAPTKRRV